jgi:hypothetical protein
MLGNLFFLYLSLGEITSHLRNAVEKGKITFLRSCYSCILWAYFDKERESAI